MSKNNLKDNGFIDKFSAVIGAVGRQRHLGAIRDGFVTIMPLMILGSLGTLINNFPVGKEKMLRDILSEVSWLKWIVTQNGNIWWGTFGLISIFAVVAIAFHLAKSYDGDGLQAAIVALSAYLCSVPQVSGDAWGVLHWGYLNSGALFVAIIFALGTTEIFVRLAKTDKLTIKMPGSVPPAVSRSFAALLPAIITVSAVVVITSLLNTYVADANYNNIFAIVTNTIVSPMTTASGSFGFGLVVVLLTHVFWMFGIHGANIFEGILQPFNAIAVENNLNYLESGVGSALIFNKSFADAFIYMGGVGVGLGLVIALLVAGKSKQNRMIGRLGAAPALFNINEPVLFGLPIVLNPIYIVPFILGPLASFVIAYAATAIGFLPPVSYIIPWTMPPILSGLMATGFAWQAPVIQMINLALSVLIYIPFVKIADRIEAKKEAAEKA